MDHRRRRPVVGVLGSGTREHAERAGPLGRGLAECGVHLLTGGGEGVMTAVSRSFSEVPDRVGLIIGVVPGNGADRSGYPNPWVEIAIRTHLPLSGRRGTEPMSRNHINVLSSDVLVALPGAWGTASEVALAVRYRRPLIGFLRTRGEIPGFPGETPVASEVAEVLDFVRSRTEGTT